VHVAEVAAAAGALARRDPAVRLLRRRVAPVVAAHRGERPARAHVHALYIGVREDGILIQRLAARVRWLGADGGNEERGGTGEQRHRARAPDKRHDW
jgi:hypothetical protein